MKIESMKLAHIYKIKMERFSRVPWDHGHVWKFAIMYEIIEDSSAAATEHDICV